MRDIECLEVHWLTHPGSNPDGKFYFTALAKVSQAGGETVFVVGLNWGRGRGDSAPEGWGHGGQSSTLGPFNTDSAARAAMNQKITEKLGGGYTKQEAPTRPISGLPTKRISQKFLNTMVQASGVGPSTGVDTPSSPPPAVTTFTLLAERWTPELAQRLVAHRKVLQDELSQTATVLANKQAEIELLDRRLSTFT